MIKFRMSNHNFPVEKGRWENIELADRKCLLCHKNDIGDEFHYLLVCPFFLNERNKLIKKYYHKYPNIIKFNELLNTKNETQLNKLSKFMGHVMSAFSRMA